MVSTCSSGLIKLWDLNKNIIKEITFPHQIDSVCFMKEDILVAHDQKISKIKSKKFLVKNYQ